MIFYRRFSFVAPPRTASTWVIHACEAAGLGTGNKSKVHYPAADRRTEFVLCTVRHPCTWLRSFYDNIGDGVIGVPKVDLFSSFHRKSSSFDSFVNTYLQEAPGAVGRMFDSYHASGCICVENLPFGLIEFLQSPSIGVKNAYEKIRNIPRQNCSKILAPKMDARLYNMVIDAEQDFCERYDYL